MAVAPPAPSWHAGFGMAESFLSQSSIEAWREFRASRRLLYGLDFDGTLAPIVLEPMKARMSPETLRLVTELKARGPTVVVSGRSVPDLRILLDGFTPDALIGNHGLEGTVRGDRFRVSAERLARSWKQALLDGLSPLLLRGGILLEDKRYSLSLHYRVAADTRRARDELGLAVRGMVASGKLDPAPRLIEGKEVLNLVPADAPDKGEAMGELIERFGVERGFYMGDDDTDEDVFRLRDPRIFGVRVGFRSDSAARWHLRDQSEVNPAIRILLESD